MGAGPSLRYLRPLSGVPLRRILRLARPERRRLVLGTLCLFVGSAMALLYPQGIRLVVDGALGQAGASRGTIDHAALFMLAIFLVEGGAVALRAFLFSTAGERIVATLREDLYRAIVAQEIAFFDERRTGELVSRLASDTTILQSTVTANVSMGLRHAVAITGGLGFLLYTSPRLTVLMLAVVPAVVVAGTIYGRRIRRLSRRVQDALAEASQVAEESIAGIRTVRSFAAEAEEARRYDVAVEKSFALARTRALASSSVMGILSFAGYGAVAAVLWLGGRMAADGAMSVGQLTAFVVYTLTVAFALGGLAEVWADLMRASGAATRVFELLDRPSAMADQGGIVLAHVDGRLELDGVGFAYPARPDACVLDAIDLDIAPGEAVALVGPSGAGKSTIAALVGRLYDPDAGTVRIDGHDARTLDPTWLRRQIGTVAQEPILFSGTIADNIRYGRAGASDAELEAAARAANAWDFIQRFPAGLATLVGERGVQLSGGQKQRIAIARAVLKDPRILILDEATSALDAESEHLVKEATRRLMRGRTTLVIAHRLSTVIDADRVFVLDGGRVVQTGSHTALMAEDGIYRRLVERQLMAR